MMKSAVYLLALALLTPEPSPAYASDGSGPQQTAELIDARAIVETIMPAAQRQGMVRTMMQQIGGQLQQGMPLPGSAGDPGLRKLIENANARLVEASIPSVGAFLPKLAEAMAVAYTQEFGPAELKEIRAFAETPAGRHYLSRSSAILGNPAVAAANQAYFRDLSPIIEAQRKILESEVASYLEAHPDVAEKIAASRKAE